MPGLATVRRGYVDGRWGQVHVRLAGDVVRPPLLLLHPTPKSGWIYETLMEALGATRRAIAPDTPGYGASDAPPEPPSIETHADAMIEVLDALTAEGRIGDGAVDIVGYHTGSVIATAMARRHPARVRRLVLVSLPAYDARQRAEKLERLGGWPAPAADGGHLLSMWRLVESLCDPRADIDWRQASVVENLRPGRCAPWGYEAVYRYDLQAALDTLEHPALILNPEDDLWEVTRANAHRVRNGCIRDLPGLAHGLFELEVERVAGLVEDFLSG